jgi:hypothetical protein
MAILNWSYVEPLKRIDAVERFAKSVGTELPAQVARWLAKNNAGIPDPATFDTQENEGYEVKGLLSYNKGDEENIYTLYPLLAQEGFYPLALEGSGDVIALDIERQIYVLISHETDEVSPIDTASCPGLFPELSE